MKLALPKAKYARFALLVNGLACGYFLSAIVYDTPGFKYFLLAWLVWLLVNLGYHVRELAETRKTTRDMLLIADVLEGTIQPSDLPPALQEDVHIAYARFKLKERP